MAGTNEKLAEGEKFVAAAIRSEDNKLKLNSRAALMQVSMARDYNSWNVFGVTGSVLSFGAREREKYEVAAKKLNWKLFQAIEKDSSLFVWLIIRHTSVRHRCKQVAQVTWHRVWLRQARKPVAKGWWRCFWRLFWRLISLCGIKKDQSEPTDQRELNSRLKVVINALHISLSPRKSISQNHFAVRLIYLNTKIALFTQQILMAVLANITIVSSGMGIGKLS